MSTDGGLTWSPPIQVNQTPTDRPAADQQAFNPSIRVAADGTVAVTYYDFRNNTPDSGALTDYWAAFGNPHGPGGLANPANWGKEIRLTDSPFDIEAAPISRGSFLGDYEGLTAIGDQNQFLAFFAQAGPSSGTSTIYSTQFDPPTSDGAPSSTAVLVASAGGLNDGQGGVLIVPLTIEAGPKKKDTAPWSHVIDVE
jgi:hypothetical protein